MKRQKPNFLRDWFDEFTRWEKWHDRKLERIIWKRTIRKELNDKDISSDSEQQSS